MGFVLAALPAQEEIAVNLPVTTCRKPEREEGRTAKAHLELEDEVLSAGSPETTG
jgi:hypothetical protein